MTFKINSKRSLVLALAAALAISAAAIAYWSTTGTGSGSGVTQADYDDQLAIAASEVENTAGLVPGGSVAISGSVTNPNEGAAAVGTILGSVDAAGSDCSDAFFTIDTVSMDAGEVIAAGATESFTAVLHMEDSATVNQDGCKSETLNISWSSN